MTDAFILTIVAGAMLGAYFRISVLILLLTGGAVVTLVAGIASAIDVMALIGYATLLAAGLQIGFLLGALVGARRTAAYKA